MTDETFESMKRWQKERDEKIRGILLELASTPMSFKRRILYCPMCLTKIEITDPDNLYECPECRALFDVVSYGKQYEV